jgi:hypothetical protein
MLNSITVQKIVLGLITLAGILAAPLLTSQVLSGNFTWFSLVAGLAFSLLLVNLLKENVWILIPAFLTTQGRLNFIPANFSMMETAVLVAILFLVFKIIFKHDTKLRFGPWWFYAPVLVLACILLVHWVASRDIGLRIFGGENFGGRKYWSIFLGFLSTPLLFTMIKPKDPALFWIPLIYLLAACVDFGTFLLSTFVPGIAPLVYQFYSNVNLEAFRDTITGAFAAETIIRVGDIGLFAAAAQVVIFSYFPAHRWLQPSYWWCWPASLLCLVGCIFSGFRSYLFRFLVTVVSAIYISARTYLFLFFGLAAATVVCLVLGQGRLFDLPMAMQRTLTFLPGDWDYKARESAEGSNKFRQSIKDVYWKEFAPNGMWFGQGMTYGKEWTLGGIDEFYMRSISKIQFNEEYDRIQTARAFVSRRQTHEGLEDIHLPTGWVGTVALIIMFSSTSIWALLKVARLKVEAVHPIQIWGISLLLVETLSYFTVYGDMSMAIPRICVLFPVLYRSFEPSPNETSSERVLPSNISGGPVLADVRGSSQFEPGNDRW